jgi:hypothetical protein
MNSVSRDFDKLVASICLFFGCTSSAVAEVRGPFICQRPLFNRKRKSNPIYLETWKA